MFNRNKIIFNALFGLLVILNTVLGFSEDLVKEKPCIQPPPIADPNFDQDWMFRVKIWYPTYGSKEGFYKSTQALVHNEEVFNKLRDDQLVKLSCMWVEIVPGFLRSHGPNGMLEEFSVSYPSKGVFIFKPVISSHGTGGYTEATLTDGFSYIFFAECWDGNQEGWQVLTTSKTVDKQTEDIIYAHAKSLGFNEKFFFKVNYSNCEGFQSPASLESQEISYSPYRLQSSNEFSNDYKNLEYPNYENGF